jgi:hypothetical protein
MSRLGLKHLFYQSDFFGAVKLQKPRFRTHLILTLWASNLQHIVML